MPIIVSEMSKAFSRVSYSPLLAKIRNHGTGNPFLSWLQFYPCVNFRVFNANACFSSFELLLSGLFRAPALVLSYSCYVLTIYLKLFFIKHESCLSTRLKCNALLKLVYLTPIFHLSTGTLGLFITCVPISL